VSKRHQSSRRKSYGRRQHELRERAERHQLPEAVDVDGEHGASSSIDPLAFLEPRTARLYFAGRD
jgi:hypothetical protein